MLLLVLGITAAVAVGVAFYKHHTFAGVVASAKKEVSYLESVASKVETTVKAEFEASVARLKNLF